MARRKIERIFFSDDVVWQLVPAEKGRHYWVQDEVIPELRLRICHKRKTWYFYKTVNYKSISLKLGDFPRVAAREARAVIEPMLKGCEFGEHPKQSRRKSLEKRVPEYGEVLAAYLNNYIKVHKRAKESRETEQSFNRCHQVFADKRVDEISRADIQQWVNQLGEERGRGSANREFRRLQSALHYGEKMEMYRLDVDRPNMCICFQRIPAPAT